jgi:hypothetical protein
MLHARGAVMHSAMHLDTASDFLRYGENDVVLEMSGAMRTSRHMAAICLLWITPPLVLDSQLHSALA